MKQVGAEAEVAIELEELQLLVLLTRPGRERGQLGLTGFVLGSRFGRSGGLVALLRPLGAATRTWRQPLADLTKTPCCASNPLRRAAWRPLISTSNPAHASR